LRNPATFKINPFLIRYLAAAYKGNNDYQALAEALILPRWLGTSINTSFGSKLQSFVTSAVRSVKGSLVAGMDIEFTDHLDGNYKYCQLKSGPQTINRGDVAPLKNKFRGAINLARTNNQSIGPSSFGVGVLYGRPEDLTPFYLEIAEDYNVWVGEDFWHRLTGRGDAYEKLVFALEREATSFNASSEYEGAVKDLARRLEETGIW